MEEDVPSGGDNIVTEFTTYEDFLDSQITSLDLYYLEVNFYVTSVSIQSVLQWVISHPKFIYTHVLQILSSVFDCLQMFATFKSSFEHSYIPTYPPLP